VDIQTGEGVVTKVSPKVENLQLDLQEKEACEKALAGADNRV